MSKIKNTSIDLETFKTAVDNAYDHIVITDIEGVVVYANKAVERITGFELEEVIGKKAGKLWGGLMPEEFYKNFWKVIAEDKNVFVGEITNKKKNGDIYTAEIRVTPVLDDAGEVEYFIGIERDKVEERRVRELSDIAVDRELRMKSLKEEIVELKEQLNQLAALE